MAKHISSETTFAPLCFYNFSLCLPRQIYEAQRFNLQYSDQSKLSSTADKLRWHRYHKGLLQREVAERIGIERTTYIRYEEKEHDYYPLKHMKMLAELFEVPLEDLLDDYNLFLLRGQGTQIKGLRLRQGMTQKEYAQKLGVSLQKLKEWEQDRVRIYKSTWEKHFAQGG